MSAEQRAVPLRPALQRAAQALCEAATPEAARAAADALDVQCAKAFDFANKGSEYSATSFVVGGLEEEEEEGEHTTLTTALLGATASTMVALFRSRTYRHVDLVAALMCCRRLRTTPGAKAALGGGRVLTALLDALLAAENPAMRAIADASGSADCGPLAMALDNLLCALSEAINVWPRAVERLAAAPQCNAVLRCVARAHKPLGRRADARGTLAFMHSSATSVLQSLTSRELGAELLWTRMQDTARALVASLVAQVRRARLRDVRASKLPKRLPTDAVSFASQGAAACKRPITSLYVPNEAACACSILCNCVAHQAEEVESVLDELCAAGLPAALRALLHESSALLRPTAEDMEALPPVIDLLCRLLSLCQRARCALLTDAPDGGAGLLLVLFAVSQHHPHARKDGTARGPQQNAAALALKVKALLNELHCSDAVAWHAIVALLNYVGVADDAIMQPETTAEAQAAAGQRLAIQLGWEGGVGSDVSGADASSAPEMAAARRVRITTSCDVGTAIGDCAGCNRLRRADEAAFLKCGRCRATPYCSRACQAAHWKTHKLSCTAAPGTA
jgi:hypothetical protein